MKSKSPILLKLANGYIILSILYYWVETQLLNPFAIGLALLFLAHVFIARNNVKLIFPSILIMLSLFMFLALFSEFSEFSELNMDAITLLLVGSLYLGLNIMSGVIIIRNTGSTGLNPTH